ncbi:MAG: DUF4340 domain-containing protein [Dokdonella sp.]
MRRQQRHLLFAFVVALLLGAAVLIQIRHEKAQWPAPLTALVPSEIQHVQLECSSCVRQRYERIDGIWWMREPDSRRADVERVGNLTAIANAVVRSRKSLAGLSLAKLGLEPAQATLTLDGTRIAFGAFDSINGDRYVRIDEQDQVALVPDHFSPYLFAAPAHMDGDAAQEKPEPAK